MGPFKFFFVAVVTLGGIIYIPTPTFYKHNASITEQSIRTSAAGLMKLGVGLAFLEASVYISKRF